MAAGVAGPVLVTGSTGLVGSWTLVHWPVDGPQVVAMGRADVDLLEPGAAADVVADVRPAAVLHLAWSASGLSGYRDHGDFTGIDLGLRRHLDAGLFLPIAAEGNIRFVMAEGGFGRYLAQIGRTVSRFRDSRPHHLSGRFNSRSRRKKT